MISIKASVAAEGCPAAIALHCRAVPPAPRRPSEAVDELEVIGDAVDLIAARYLLDTCDVWNAVLELEGDVLEDTRQGQLGRLLSTCGGVSMLGIRVAQKLIKADGDQPPILNLSIH